MATSEADKELGENLTEVLVAALAQQANIGGIVGQEEFRAQLGQSDRGVLGCVGDPPCLTRVGRFLKVDVVLVAQVTRAVGDEYLVNANTIEVSTGKVLRQLLRRPRGQKALIDAVRALAKELFRPATARLRVEVNADADVYIDGRLVGRGRSVDVPDLLPGTHKVRARATGMTAFEGDVELAADEQRSLGVSLIAMSESRPFYKTWWFWTLVGVAAAGGATGAVLATRPSGALPQANLGTVGFGNK